MSKHNINKENYVFEDDILEKDLNVKNTRYNPNDFENVNYKMGRNSHLIKKGSKLRTADPSRRNFDDQNYDGDDRFRNGQFDIP